MPGEEMIKCGEIQIYILEWYIELLDQFCSSKGSRIIVYDWPRDCTVDSEETFMQLPGHLEVCKN